MADRNSAEIFRDLFLYLADRSDAPWARDMARFVWRQSMSYDFHPDDMGIDDALLELGLARRTYDGKGHQYIYQDLDYR